MYKDISDLIIKINILEKNINNNITDIYQKINVINTIPILTCINTATATTPTPNIKNDHIAIYSNDTISDTHSLINNNNNFEIKSIKSDEFHLIKNNLNKSEENKNKSDENKNKSDENKNKSDEINNYDEKNLVKLKLSDLQLIANKLNLDINKEINGNIKNKTKQELIINILEKNI